MTTVRLSLGDAEHSLDLTSFRLSEADDLVRLTGWNNEEWIEHLNRDHPDAIRFAWMLANQRAGTPLAEKFHDIDFDIRDFDVALVEDQPVTVVDGAEGSDLPTGPPAE